MEITRTLTVKITVETRGWRDEYGLDSQAEAATDFTESIRSYVDGVAEAILTDWPALRGLAAVTVTGLGRTHTTEPA